MAVWFSSMKNLILIVLGVLSAAAHGKDASDNGFVEIRSGVKLYVEHYPATPGRPTLFLGNGLTYSTRQYTSFIKAMRELDPGVGIVAWDMQGMGRTLLENLSALHSPIRIEDQARDLHDLIRTLGVTGPRSLMGLSYGGALQGLYSTLYPDDFTNYIGVAPLVERLPDQDALLRSWVISHKLMNPFDPRSADELSDHYLRILIYSTYPAAEPVILENPFKLEAVFRMVQGVKDWNAFHSAGRMPAGRMHLIAAVQDEHVKIRRLDEFWNALPEASRASYLRLASSKHKVPEQWPKPTAAWVLEIVNENPHLNRGLVFEGDPFDAVAKHGSILIPLSHRGNIALPLLDKAGDCESLLRKVPESRKN